jgi:spore coat polysaccharide biosynthesis protein SpsF
MRIGAVIQARMGSARLPGKVLAKLGGAPVIERVIARAQSAEGVDLVAVATSRTSADDPIAHLCGSLGVPVHRGPLDDVLGRFVEAAERFELDAVVRVNGDSPFIDPALVEKGVGIFRGGEFDAVTNVSPRSFPVGQSVEVVSRSALADAWSATEDPADREHVTRFIYAHPDRFRIRNFSADGDFSAASLAIDGPGDAADLEAVVARMERPIQSYSWREVLDLRAGLADRRGDPR